MTNGLRALAATLVAIATGAACTVHQADSAPSLTGPSGLAQSVSVAATPDRLTQDGRSQSAIGVRVLDSNGQPAAGIALRIDMLVDGTLVDFGTLSARTIVTGSDGRATTVYTAPPAPPATQSSDASTVTIRAIAFGTDAQTALSFTADIRLVPPGVILPPAGTPTASFFTTPSNIVAGVAAIFDASGSAAGTGASAIASYNWVFGDGATGSGRTASHTFASANSYSVTLTVTNDRGVSASTTQSVTVGTAALPTAIFNVSPVAPGVGEAVFLNASASAAAPGRSIRGYQWSFGDGGTGSGVTTSHAYQSAGTFTITLVVTDDLGQNGTTTQSVTTGNPAGPTAKFTFSPSEPGVGSTVVFVASTSTTAQGQTITDFFWNFGDDGSCPPVIGAASPACYLQTSSPTVTHVYTSKGTFIVNLVVKDSAGRTNSTSASVTVVP